MEEREKGEGEEGGSRRRRRSKKRRRRTAIRRKSKLSAIGQKTLR